MIHVKNETEDPIVHSHTGITFLAGESRELEPREHVDLLDQEFIDLVVAGDLVINDGSIDITNAALALKRLRAAPLMNVVVTSTSEATTSSSSFSTIGSGAGEMKLTPTAGTFRIDYIASCETDGVNTEGEVAIFEDSTQISASTREIRSTTSILGLVTLSVMNVAAPVVTTATVTTDGTKSYYVKFRSLSGGSVYATERSFSYTRLGE